MVHAISLLKKVLLDGKVDSYPEQLSGGEQQRVAIARALAMKPYAMLFDEPTPSPDTKIIDEVLAVIKDLVLEGMTTIIATHEMDFARNVSTFVSKKSLKQQQVRSFFVQLLTSIKVPLF